MENCICKNKAREIEEKKKLINRLSRIEGQIRGIKNMVEDDRYCIDVLTQVSAVSAALNGFSKVLLDDHLRSCVVRDIKEGNQEEAIDEVINIIGKLIK